MTLLLAALLMVAPPEVDLGGGVDLQGGWSSDPARQDSGAAALLQVAPWVRVALRAESVALGVEALGRVETSVPEALAPAARRSDTRAHASLAVGAPWLDLALHGWVARGLPADPGAPPGELRGDGGFAALLRGAGPRWEASLGYTLATTAPVYTTAEPWGDATRLSQQASASAGWRFADHGRLSTTLTFVAARPEHPDDGEGRRALDSLEARSDAQLTLGGGWSAHFWAGWWGGVGPRGAGESGGDAGTGVGGADFMVDWGPARLGFGGGRVMVPSGWGSYAAENYGTLDLLVDTQRAAGAPDTSSQGDSGVGVPHLGTGPQPGARHRAGRVRFSVVGRYAFVVHGDVPAPEADADGLSAETVPRRRYMSHTTRNSEHITGTAELFVWVARGVALGLTFRADARLSRFRLQTVTATAAGFASAYAEDRYVDLTVLGGLRLELSSEDW